MDNFKNDQYLELVKKRKIFKFSDLKNPSEIESGKYDKEDSIGPWSLWQGNLDAEILVVGQDWGDVKYYLDNKGIDSDNNPTNKNLIELFKKLNINIGTPSSPNKSAPVFFTNAILGIKYNGMSSKVKVTWGKECTEETVLKNLITKNPIEVDNKKIFAFYHCGGLGLANRKLELQKEDWNKLNDYI